MLLRGFMSVIVCFFSKQRPEYERRIRDWSSDVCSSDLRQSPSAPAIWKDSDQPGYFATSSGHPYLAYSSPRQQIRNYRYVISPGPWPRPLFRRDRKSVVVGKSVAGRVDLVCRRIIKKKNKHNQTRTTNYRHIRKE